MAFRYCRSVSVKRRHYIETVVHLSATFFSPSDRINLLRVTKFLGAYTVKPT